MPISFHCTRCGKPYTTSDDTAGKRARCRDCGNIMAIPRPAARDPYALADPPAPPRRGFDDEDEVLPPRAAYRPKARAAESGSSGKVVGGVASVFGVLAIIAVRIILRMALSNVGKGKAPEPPPPRPNVVVRPAAPPFRDQGLPAPAGPVPVTQPAFPAGPIPPNEPTRDPAPPASPAPGIGGFPQPPPNNARPGSMRPPGFRGPRFRRPPGARPF